MVLAHMSYSSEVWSLNSAPAFLCPMSPCACVRYAYFLSHSNNTHDRFTVKVRDYHGDLSENHTEHLFEAFGILWKWAVLLDLN